MTKGKQITQIEQVKKSLVLGQETLAKLLPVGMSAERFVTKVVSTIQSHPQRDKLLNADRGSLFNACKKAASDGLEIDGREAALVVFSDQVAYIPMIQGLVKLARNSGDIASIASEVVYENDTFELYEGFDGTVFKHEPNWKGERGNPILVWARIKLTNGEVILRALTKKRIDKIAKNSKNSFQYDPAKGDHFEEWWRKTVIKNALKYAPRSTYLEKAIERDNAVEAGVVDDEFEMASVIEQEEDTAPEPVKAEQAPRQTQTSKIVVEQANDVVDVEYDEEMPI